MEAKKVLACFILGLFIVLANVKTYDSAHVSVQIKGDKSGVVAAALLACRTQCEEAAVEQR